MIYHLGVDLGTTYTAAAVAREGRVEAVTLGGRSIAVPSVVHLGAGGSFVVGEAAARRALTEPRRVAREFKRRIGDPTPLVLGGTPVAAELLSARLLSWVVAEVTATEGGPPASLAVTHPANWGPYKLDLLSQAIRHVGLRVDHLVPEPVAAATTYAAQRGLVPGTVVAVYDLGGGTFDAALVRATAGGFELVGRPDGIERLGGIDFDHAVLRHVLDSLGLDPDRLADEAADDAGLASALAQLRRQCVDAKEALSADSEVDIPVMLPSRHTEVHLTRAGFEAMIRPALAETLVAMRRAVTHAGLALDDVGAVLLVGGSSRIPLVAELVASELGRPIAVDARPKDAVPVGAALTAARRAAAAAAPTVVVPPVPAGPFPAVGPAGRSPAVGPAGPGRVPAPASGRFPAGDPAGRGAGGPSGAFPARAGGERRTRAGVLAAVAVLLVGLGAGAAVALAGGGDDEQAGDSPTPTTAPPGSTASTPTTADDTSGGTATTGVDAADPGGLGGLGGLGGGALGASDGEPNDPLPGTDWNPEARTAFVGDCADELAVSGGGMIPDPSATCGCVYDELEAGDVSFAEVNEQWALADADPDSAAVQAMQSASLSCVMASAG